VSEAIVPPHQAVEQLRKADERWEAALRAFDDYPTRLRTLADAADLRSRALTLAHLANITLKPRPNADKAQLAFELSAASNRPGPKAVWQRFDQVVKDMGQALGQGDIQRTASLFDALSKIAHELADACAVDQQRLGQVG
jgi:hypothetical protein